MEIHKTPIGILVLKNGKLIDKALFPKDPGKIAKRMSGESGEEKKLRKKYPKAEKGKKRLPLGELAEETGFCTKKELPKILSAVNEEISKKGVSAGFGKDKLIVNAVRAQKSVEDNANTNSETLREWYSIHFPELDDLLKENETYAKTVGSIGDRNNMTEKKLKEIIEDKRYIKSIPQIAKESIGTDIPDEDMETIRDYAGSVLSLTEQSSRLRTYLEEGMEEIAPNVSEVATAYVGALLLEQAGSLERLAKLPASTIQVLGAQKAMFRFLKTHKKPPKYGVLYVHPLVSQASKKNKGRMARTLASKISIAAKVDFHGGEPIGEKLRKGTEERAKSLKK
jgi:nucleolar protein 56